MKILHDKINPNEALSICSASDGDMQLISRAYEYVKTKNVDNFVGYMIKVIEKMKLNEFNEQKKSSNINGFVNFEPRKYDYDDLERKLLGWDNDSTDDI